MLQVRRPEESSIPGRGMTRAWQVGLGDEAGEVNDLRSQLI